jgi:4-amino-4-deoxy-L-arabinose transferase-like glycosyltransferase
LIRLGLILLILVSSLLAASTWRIYGHTWDEPEHLAAGLELLDRGKYEYDTEHPPIARVLIALGPFLTGSHSFGTPPPDGTQEGIDILYDGGHYDRTLMLARLGTLPFLAVLLLAMWLWARRIAASEGEALLAVLLLATVPPIIGHAALAALDIPGTATTLLALYLLQKWVGSGSRRDAILFGLATGVAVGTKLSAVPFIGLGVLVLLLARQFFPAALGASEAPASSAPATSAVSGWQRRVSGFAWIVLATMVPIVLAYGRRSIDLTELPARFDWVLGYLFPGGSTAHGLAYSLLGHVRLPEAFWDFAEGVVALKAHNDSGHLSFLLGHVKPGGWWYFYFVALAVKTPLPLLATGPIGLGLLARDGWRERNLWRVAPAVLFVTLLAFASLFSRINIGIRHVLILYPFLAMGGAYALGLAWRSGSLVGKSAVALLVVWQVSTLATAYPDYFPYFNETVGHPEHVLVDSDLDWGQDLRRLERRLAELKVPSVSLAYQGTADLAKEMLPPYVLLPPRKPATGWVAITALTREHEPAGYTWLDAYRPVERVGKTIDLYFIAP